MCIRDSPHGALAGTCPAGYKLNSSLTDLYCTSFATDAVSCNANCCEPDDTKCFYYVGSLSCATSKYYDPASAGTATYNGGADKNTDCCTAKAACSASGTSCSAGYKKRSTLTDLYCTSSATNAASCNPICCEKDTTKCGGLASNPCSSTEYWEPAKAQSNA